MPPIEDVTTEAVVVLNSKQLREKALGGGAKFNSKRVTVKLGGTPCTFEVREPTEAEQAFIFKAGGMKEVAQTGKDKAGEAQVEFTNSAAMSVWSTIYCARDTDGNKVFSAGDAESLLARPASDPLCKVIGAAVMELIQEGAKAGKT